MFVLRCAFWLSVVYASMSWNDARFAVPGLATQALAVSHDAGAIVAKSVAASAASFCADRAAACLDDAAKLTALFESVQEPPARHGAGSAKSGRGVARPS